MALPFDPVDEHDACDANGGILSWRAACRGYCLTAPNMSPENVALRESATRARAA
jgi:hypothetical protein